MERWDYHFFWQQLKLTAFIFFRSFFFLHFFFCFWSEKSTRNKSQNLSTLLKIRSSQPKISRRWILYSWLRVPPLFSLFELFFFQMLCYRCYTFSKSLKFEKTFQFFRERDRERAEAKKPPFSYRLSPSRISTRLTWLTDERTRSFLTDHVGASLSLTSLFANSWIDGADLRTARQHQRGNDAAFHRWRILTWRDCTYAIWRCSHFLTHAFQRCGCILSTMTFCLNTLFLCVCLQQS